MRISDWSSDVCSSDLFMRMRLERAFHVPELPARVVFPAFSCDTRIAVGRGHVDRLQQQRRVGVAIHARAAHRQRTERFAKMGRAACRERVCKDGADPLVAGTLKKKNKT